MKKVIVAVFAWLVTVFTVNAQVFVGGGLRLGFSNGQSSWSNSENSGSGFGFRISPQVGYYLNDNLAIGVSGYLVNSWSNSKDIYPDNPSNDRESKGFGCSWGVGVFGRYRLMGLGIENLSLLVEGLMEVQGSNNKYTENETTTKYPGDTVYGINARPVLAYKLSDKFEVLAHCDFLTIGCRYQTRNKPDDNYKSKNHSFDLGFNSFSDLHIGFIYRF